MISVYIAAIPENGGLTPQNTCREILAPSMGL